VRQRQQWEYRVISCPRPDSLSVASLEAQLAELGLRGFRVRRVVGELIILERMC